MEEDELDRVALLRIFPWWNVWAFNVGVRQRGFVVYARDVIGPDGRSCRKIRNTNKCAGTIRGAR